LRVAKDGKETNLAVGEGFVEVTGERVIVLTDMAVEESDIDAEAAEEAVRRAEKAMSDQKLSGEEFATTSAALQRSLALVRVKRRRHV
jgi:F-type H+-transporting ATPase subunit epsilon